MNLLSNNKKKVLIVDDSIYARKLLKKVINKTDLAEVVAEASNGTEAIDLYKIFKPDLVTVDLVMPKKGGFETIEDLIRYDNTANIIIISALGQEKLVLEGVKKGAKDFIIKPCKDERILTVLERVLTREKELSRVKQEI